MIRRAEARDACEVLRRAQSAPAIGVLLEMQWRLYEENPRLPYAFYLADEGALMKLSGRRAALCGEVRNAEETAAFLAFQGVEMLHCLDFAPPGWVKREEQAVLVRPPAFVGREKPPPGFDEAPPPRDVLEVLESADGRMRPEALREGFLVEMMVCRNHGAARVYGLWEGGVLAGTAGAYAVTPAAAYIACVQTRPAARGRGVAAALLRQLCAALPGRTLSLLCRDELAGYYRRFGFAPLGRRGFTWGSPREFAAP